MENILNEGSFNQAIGSYLIVGIVIMRIVWDIISFMRVKLHND